MSQRGRSDILTPSAEKVLRALPPKGTKIAWHELLRVLRPMSTQGLARAVYQLEDRRLVKCGGWNGSTYGWVEDVR